MQTVIKNSLEMMGGETAWSKAASKRLLEQALSDEENEVNETDWIERHEDFVKENGITYTNSTYLSPRFGILPGGAHFTWNPFYHIKVPKGDYVLTRSQFDIVDGTGSERSIPLTELYNHHWLIGTHSPVGFDPLGLPPFLPGMCEEDLFWGGGAEYRKLDYTVPEGYGIKRVGASGVCGANLHFIRVDDLATSWKGFNDPKGNAGAAVKNCAECGWGPGKSPLCIKEFDGFWPCCFLGARCAAKDSGNATWMNTKKFYRMKYTLTWTRQFSTFKNLRVHCLDLGGHVRIEKQNFLFGIEWNAGPYLNNAGSHQRCNETVCNITNTAIVGEQTSLQNGICAGEMIWSYMHMHGGAISGSMFINGNLYCTSKPTYGIDATNPPGNEKGFVVDISTCVSEHAHGNKVRLHKGDVVTVNALYDVDPASTRTLPQPGGKLGGVMALFFAMMDCDAGTWGEKYVCRENTCVGVKKQLPFYEKKWQTIDDCQKSCGSTATLPSPALRGSPTAVSVPEAAPVLADGVDLSPAPVGVEGLGRLQTSWQDCSGVNAIATIDSFTTSARKNTIPLHGKTNLLGAGILSKDIEGGSFKLKLEAGVFGLTLIDMVGDICSQKSVSTLYGLFRMSWEGMECPVKAGNASVPLSITINAIVPLLAAMTTTTVVATRTTGEQIFCMEVITTGRGSAESNTTAAGVKPKVVV
jgi:hypothetical protein